MRGSCVGSTVLWGRPELQVLAVLGTARSVVEFSSLVAAIDDGTESVVRIHNGFDADHRVVRRAEGVLQVADSLDDERSCRGVATEHFWQVGIGPVRNVVVRLILAQIPA